MTTAEQIEATVEAEQTVIGALLLAAPGLQTAALDELTDDDFTDLRCRFAISTARRMVADGVPVDPATFCAYVNRHALLSDGALRGSLPLWAADLTISVPVAANLPWYVLALVEQASRRQIVEAGERIANVASVGSVVELSSVVGVAMTAMTVALERLRAVVADA